MQINVTFDQNVATLPAGFVAAVDYVANYFDGTFINPVTVNIDVGYGEIAGQSLGTGALGESEAYIDNVSYAQAVAALKANEPSPTQQASYATLPASSPLSGGTLWMATAEEKALGLLAGNNPSIDGYVGFSSVYPFSYAINSSPVANQYYFIGIVEHEITEVLGRDSWLGDGLGDTTSYGVMDLFRYSAPGVRDLTATLPSPYDGAYFSINNGSTDLDNWNTDPNGDLGDWAASAGVDAFLAFSSFGQIDQVGATDLTLMNVLGWDLPAVATPEVAQDFVGNGTSDVLLQYGGTVVDWIMQNGGYSSGHVLTTGAAGWQVVGTGDFTGTGTSDVVLQNGGTVVDWIMKNGQYQSGNVLTTGAANWTVVGTGDFTGTGTSDVLLQNGSTVVEWLMQNGQYSSGNVVTARASGWSVVGTGDFTGSGVSDVLLQNGGTVVEWLMQNGQYSSSNVLTTGAAGWTVVGTGDFTGTGTSDVLLQNGGTIVDWIMKNGQYQSGNVVTTAAAGFTVVGTGDYNGDGTSDVLLQSGGTVVDWIMKNGAYQSGNVITNGAAGYQVVKT